MPQKVPVKALLILFFIVFVGAGQLVAQVVVYPGLPGGLYQSKQYTVTVIQSNVAYSSYVYESFDDYTLTNPVTASFMSLSNHWSSFSFTGAVQVKVTLPLRTNLASATVRPLVQGIPATINSNTITFTITNPGAYYLQVDGEQRNPLFIFANPPEINVPLSNDVNTVYFAPGVYDIGTTNIPSGKTVYIAGGAYVRGRIYAAGPAGSITVRGRGILSGINLGSRGSYDQFMIDATSGWTGAPNITVNVEGITITDPPGPHIQVNPGYAMVNNVKFLSWFPTTDGVEGGPGTVISNCFFKVMDDNMHFDVDNVQACNNVVWQQMGGSVIQMGWGATASIYSGHVCGLDLIANDWGAWSGQVDGSFYNRGLVTLMNMGDADAASHPLYVVESGLVVENVRVETVPLQLFSIKIKGDPADGFPRWVLGDGSVSNLTFRNISVAQMPEVRSGFNGNGSYAGNISGVTFDNLTIAGTLVTATNATNYLFQLGATSDFVYTNSSRSGPGPTITSPGLYTNQFGFLISGALNQTVVVEACTNLADPTWMPLATNTLNGNPALFIDPMPPQRPSLYYRLRSQ